MCEDGLEIDPVEFEEMVWTVRVARDGKVVEGIVDNDIVGKLVSLKGSGWMGW